ncbi:RNA polymerase sigma-70 factor (ECF subfamily) [Paraburkholderia eburnea]|uniref:RNA polymerase sigma factor n=1 Tax=Paraburkholderia eburnea TaxID=1189126 RepID=A0A2S4M414_9BURK|nr:RNA polymerase sigma factor [Paraburkholderia eburnea]POR49440.1 RNA polymerase sigma-70 factor (ECF subfamily) [Paraburkholderia eburnea]PRZ19930.1 RNA polymerase sigma-70 factor (ECF subfamily) [Paraburkholderia eburnea]
MDETANGQHEGEGRQASDALALEVAARSRRFQALTLPHLDAAYNLARWLSRSPGDAEDIVQEAFLRAFRFFDTFRGDEARPWLLAIVRRVWYDEWRRRAGAQEVAQFDELRDDVAPEGWDTGGVDPETLAIRAESTRHVHEALQRLPVEYREVLVLRELEELEYREIATVIDVPMGTVMSRLARARKRLAALLAAQGHGARNGGNEKGDLAVGGSSGKAWRPSGRGPDDRFREEPAVDGGAHEPRARNRPVGPRTTEAPDEL